MKRVLKPIIIGQAPGPNTDPRLPLYPVPYTSAGGRLCSLMGLRRQHYLMLFDRINLIREFPGKWNTREDCWNTRHARIAAQAIEPLLQGRVVILLGRRVSNAFGYCPKTQAEFYVEYLDEDWNYEYMVIPHPSGRNHWYNKPGNRELAREFWERVLEPVKELVAISPEVR